MSLTTISRMALVDLLSLIAPLPITIYEVHGSIHEQDGYPRSQGLKRSVNLSTPERFVYNLAFLFTDMTDASNGV